MGGYKTKASANTAYHKLRNKIQEAGKKTVNGDATEGDADAEDVPAQPSTKTRGKKTAAIKPETEGSDDDEAPKTIAKPKKAVAPKKAPAPRKGRAVKVVKKKVQSEEEDDDDEEESRPVRSIRASNKVAAEQSSEDDNVKMERLIAASTAPSPTSSDDAEGESVDEFVRETIELKGVSAKRAAEDDSDEEGENMAKRPKAEQSFDSNATVPGPDLKDEADE